MRFRTNSDVLKLLDANVLMHVANRAEGYERIRETYAAQRAGTIHLSAVTVCELHYKIGQRSGKKPPKKENVDRLEELVRLLGVMPFNEAAAKRAAELRCALEAIGEPIGLVDSFLAGHALALGATVVTDNESEFRRVKGLTVDNWRRRQPLGTLPIALI